MEKRNKIIYWIFTIWFSFGMTFNAVSQLLKVDAEVVRVTHLGYPEYLLYLLGTLKLFGVIALLMPKYPLVKLLAYAGFTFLLIGALYSHIAFHDPFKEIFPALLFSVLLSMSYFFRPANRKLVLHTKTI